MRTDTHAVTVTERVLFEERLGTQWVRVWLDASGGGIAMRSHDIGPDLERFFGTDDVETHLEIDAEHLPALTAALRADRIATAAQATGLDLLADRYDGNSGATSVFRTWLDQRGIPYR